MTRTLKLYNVAVRCGVLSTLNDLIDDLDERKKEPATRGSIQRSRELKDRS